MSKSSSVLTLLSFTSSRSFLIFCFRELYSPNICFLSLRSSSLDSLWKFHILREDALSSFQILFFSSSIFTLIFSPRSFTSKEIFSETTTFSKYFFSTSSVRRCKSESIFSRTLSTVLLIFVKSSSITLKVLPTQEKSGTSCTPLTHSGTVGIESFIPEICSESSSNSLS